MRQQVTQIKILSRGVLIIKLLYDCIQLLFVNIIYGTEEEKCM